MLSRTLTTQLELIAFTVERNLESITEEQALQPPAGGGNCIQWILGHMLHTRGAMLAFLGGEPVLDGEAAQPYVRGAEGLTPGAPHLPLAELLRLFEASQTQLVEKLAAAGAANFERRVPGLFQPDEQVPIGTQLAQLVFHDAYHAGQLGTVRRAIGLAPALR